jgi:hypothetical protein
MIRKGPPSILSKGDVDPHQIELVEKKDFLPPLHP